MVKLSFCIPIEDGSADPYPLASSLLTKNDLDIEVIIAAQDGFYPSDEIQHLVGVDPRLKFSEILPKSASAHELWAKALQSATGEWVTLALPQDMVEPELAIVADYLTQNSPAIDAVAWNSLQIDPNAPREVRQSIAIPIDYSIAAFDKNVMLKNFYFWENSRNIPSMPFGLYHGMIRKTLADTVLASLSGTGRKPCLPRFEWAARVVLLANDLAFCARPMSAISVNGYVPPEPVTITPGIPFHAGMGITGGIAEIQYSVLKEMGSDWGGCEEAFVRACMIDCMLETNADMFAGKAQSYFEALSRWQGGRFVPLFQPQYTPDQPKDIRRGLHGEALMIDRFIGGARTPQDFYRIVRSFLAPIRLICGGATV